MKGIWTAEVTGKLYLPFNWQDKADEPYLYAEQADYGELNVTKIEESGSHFLVTGTVTKEVHLGKGHHTEDFLEQLIRITNFGELDSVVHTHNFSYEKVRNEKDKSGRED